MLILIFIYKIVLSVYLHSKRKIEIISSEDVMGTNLIIAIGKRFNTIRTKLLLIFLLFTLILIFSFLLFYKIYHNRDENVVLKDNVQQVYSNILILNKLQFQFIIYDSKNNDFYLTGKSYYIEKHKNLFQLTINNIDSLESGGGIDESIRSDLKKLRSQLNEYNKTFFTFIQKIEQRGFRDFGLEGSMRKSIHNVENFSSLIDMEVLLTVRRNEKDYILRKDPKYLTLHNNNVILLIKKIEENREVNKELKIELYNLIYKYQEDFNKWIVVDKEIGIDQGIGLTLALKNFNSFFETSIFNIINTVNNSSRDLNTIYNTILLFTVFISILLSIALSLVFSLRSTKSIITLSNAITDVVKGNFSKPVSLIIGKNSSQDEIGILFRNFNLMINKINSHIEQIQEHEKIISQSEKKFRALIENSNDAIILTDKKGDILYSSPASVKITGYSNKEQLNNTVFEFVHPKDILQLKNIFEEILNFPDKSIEIQLRILHKTGEYIWLDGSITNLLNDESVQAIVANYRDISNRRRNELKIQEQYKELQKINFELDKFVYSASHDLKAPLTSVLGIINLVKIDPDKESLQKYLSMAEINIKRLLRIINDLTNFSRNERLEISSDKIDFETLINESIASFNYLDNFNKISFNFSIEKEYVFYSDNIRIGILLNNLILNAILYHNLEQDYPYINISVESFEDTITVSVEDNGRGIDKNYHEKIFDMFYRATEDSTGSGLGLYIVKGILEKIDARIELESYLGKGTTFTIFFPNSKNIVENEKITEYNV